MIQYLRKCVYVLLCLLMAGELAAQEQQYFVYIQSEKSQPFYVKYKGKVLSSSDRGYIILSPLPAGTTPLTIGFPKNEAPEQQFRVRLGKNDQGFLLKQADEKTYALYNLQTFSVTKAGAGTEDGESGRQVSLDSVNANTTPTGDTAPQPAAAPTEVATPAAVEAVPDTTGKAMMTAMQKDLDTALAGKAEVTAIGKPAKKSTKFSETLDKVVSDDRPDDIPLEEPAAPPVTEAAAPVAGAAVDAAGIAVAAGTETKKGRRKRAKDKERVPLTEEEQMLLKEVMAEEKKADNKADSSTAAPDPVQAQAQAAPADTQPAAAPAQAALDPAAEPVVLPATEEAPVKKPRKPKRKKTTDPEFIEFMNDSTQQRSAIPATETEAAPVAVTETPADAAVTVTDTTAAVKPSKRKKKKLADAIDATEHPNNIVTDSVNYEEPVTRTEKKEKEAAAGLKMVNSDCQNLMDDATFRKLLRKFVAAKDDDGMVEAYRRNTRNYCLETSQIRRLAQLVNTDEYRYKLLDMAYPKTYDTEKYESLSNLLSDNYYQGRFKAMLHK